MTIEQIAIVAHTINKAYCTALGDNSQQGWNDAPAWQKDSAIKGVQFHLENPDAGPSASHDSWMKQKLEEGWKYGPVKDAEKKEHHCIVPFDELPKEQQAKDFLFRQIVHSLKPFIEVNATRSEPSDIKQEPIADSEQPSFGMKFVGITFNPSRDPRVDRVKGMCASMIDMVNEGQHQQQSANNVKANTLIADSAMQQVLLAQMSVVKYLTYPKVDA